MALKRKLLEETDDQILYPADDGVPMDDCRHGINAQLLRDGLWQVLQHEAFIAVNAFIYYEKGNPRKNVGPDFYVVLDTPGHPERDCWRVWNEGGRMAHVIVEFVSKSSVKKDRVTNFAIYRDVLHVPNYFICDRRRRFRLDGYRLRDGQYVPLEPDQHGRLWCEELHLFLGFHETWLRWFHEDGRIVLTGAERAAEAEDRVGLAEERAGRAEDQARRAEAEMSKLRAELERYRKQGS